MMGQEPKCGQGHLEIQSFFSCPLRSLVFQKTCLVLLRGFSVGSLLIYVVFPSSIFFWMARAEW